jgi:hypothetical protein
MLLFSLALLGGLSVVLSRAQAPRPGSPVR